MRVQSTDGKQGTITAWSDNGSRALVVWDGWMGEQWERKEEMHPLPDVKAEYVLDFPTGADRLLVALVQRLGSVSIHSIGMHSLSGSIETDDPAWMESALDRIRVDLGFTKSQFIHGAHYTKDNGTQVMYFGLWPLC